jgi:hypothetical protein
MKKSEYSQAKFEAFLKKVNAEYQGRYDKRLRHAWDSKSAEDDVQPQKMLEEIKKADSIHQRTVRARMDLRAKAHF